MNRLPSIPIEFSRLRSLTFLNVSHNSIASFPPAIFSEIHLQQSISSSSNSMHSLISRPFHSLTHFLISNNQLRHLPDEVVKRCSVLCSQLLMVRNQIGTLVSLKYLDLEENGLIGLPRSLSHLSQLESLKFVFVISNIFVSNFDSLDLRVNK